MPSAVSSRSSTLSATSSLRRKAPAKPRRMIARLRRARSDVAVGDMAMTISAVAALFLTGADRPADPGEHRLHLLVAGRRLVAGSAVEISHGRQPASQGAGALPEGSLVGQEGAQ